MTLMIDRPFPGLEPWVGYFQDVELPVLRHTAQQLDELRLGSEEVDVRKLTAIILHDPLMVLRVFGHIEKNRGKRQVTDIATVERAVMMIGVGPFFEQFQNLPIIEAQLKGFPKAMLALLKVMARARNAAHWARDWAVIRRDLEVGEIAIAALLHDFAEILMWCFAPLLASRSMARQLADRTLRSVAVQEQEYGAPLYQIKLALAKRWQLPPLLIALMDPEHAASPRVRNVKLAVDLARHSAGGWDNAALEDDYKAIEELLHIGRDNLLERVGAPEELILAARAAALPESGSAAL
jgi:HD-like signal output (HDOD) protein